MTSNQINFLKSKEEQRHNRAMEIETERANKASHTIEKTKVEVSKKGLDETIRHNLLNESLQRSYNMAQTQEQARHNKEQELLSSKQIEYNYNVGTTQAQAAYKQAQTAAYKAANDYTLALASQSEINRHNVALESVQAMQEEHNYELGRANLAQQQIATSQSNIIKYETLQEQARHNEANETETKRHNVESERLNLNVHRANTLDKISEEARHWGSSLGLLKQSRR